MLHFLPRFITALLSFVFYGVNTLFWILPIVIFSLLKAIIPIAGWQKFFSYLLDHSASGWVVVNSFIQRLFIKTKIHTKWSGDEASVNDWCMVISNHQSWVDIIILQRLLHGKVPFLKFFLKKELMYIPILGLAWWALDFPFMKRYSQAYLRKNPHLIGSDFETTRKACEKFKFKPVSIMNFIEGTRFTTEKHVQSKSPFEHLLRPKAGGIGFALSAMGEHLTKLVNVTIYYPEGIPSFLDFISGRIEQVYVDINIQDIPQEVMGDYINDKQFKHSFQKWLNEQWQEKDNLISELKAGSPDTQ